MPDYATMAFCLMQLEVVVFVSRITMLIIGDLKRTRRDTMKVKQRQTGKRCSTIYTLARLKRVCLQ